MLQNHILEIARKGRNALFGLADNAKSTFQSISEANYDKEHIRHYLAKSLDPAEKSAIKLRYGRVIPNISRGYDFFRAMKQIDRFDVNYIPSSYYYPFLLRVLNPEKPKKLLCNKSLLKFIYQTSVKQPTTPIRSLAGVYFDENNHPISPSKAKSIIMDSDGPLLYKPSTDSNSGSGIRLFSKNELPELGNSIGNLEILRNGRADFVLQKPVSQSTETSVFNPSSLNCFRVTTLNLHGKVTADSITLKCGPKNSFVDNIGSGKRGVIVGVTSDGELSEHGYYGNGERCSEHNGIKFKGRRICAINKVIEAALTLHGMIESCHVIGWDIALDYNNEPVIIEGNTNYPGISLEQMCSGPIFGERTDEVIAYVYNRKCIGGVN